MIPCHVILNLGQVYTMDGVFIFFSCLFLPGEYEISAQPDQVVDLMVIDTKGQHFVNRENTDTGKFAFTTDDYDVFEICFLSRYRKLTF